MRTSAGTRAWFVVGALLVGWSCSDGGMSPEQTLARDLQRALDEELAAHGGIGASAAVLAPGLGVWEGASGVSFGTTPVTSDMLFGLGSVTKSFVATLVLRLVEEGVLGLDDSLGEWLPDLPNVASAITIRQLLNHTSGVADFTKSPAWVPAILADLERVWSPEETITSFVSAPLFAPGAGYQYSSTNYLLVGMVVEAATGRDAAGELRSRVLTRAALAHVFFGVEEPIAGTVAHRWEDIDGDGDLDDLSSLSPNALESTLWTAGALYATARDVVEYSSALFGGRLLSPASLAAMLDWIPYPNNPALGYGFGVLIIPHFLPGVLGYGHDGTVPGFKARWVYMPEHGIHIVVLLNKDDYECLTAITSRLAEVAIQAR